MAAHIKGQKVPAIAHKAIAAGAIGVTCAKLGEAEVMAAAGISDILIANQIVGADKAARLAGLAARRDRGGRQPRRVEAELCATRAGGRSRLGVVDRGRYRHAAGRRRALARPPPRWPASSDAPSLEFRGVMGWESLRSHRRCDAKSARRGAAIGLLPQAPTRCRACRLAVDIVSCGGTGTFPYSRASRGSPSARLAAGFSATITIATVTMSISQRP